MENQKKFKKKFVFFSGPGILLNTTFFTFKWPITKKSMGGRKKSYIDDPPLNHPKNTKKKFFKKNFFLITLYIILCLKAKNSVNGKNLSHHILYLWILKNPSGVTA